MPLKINYLHRLNSQFLRFRLVSQLRQCICFYSDQLPNNAITDYLLRVVKPKLDSVKGVQNAEIIGGRKFALRAWLDREKMAGLGVGADDVYSAMSANNYLSAVGSTKGDMVAGTDLHTLA